MQRKSFRYRSMGIERRGGLPGRVGRVEPSARDEEQREAGADFGVVDADRASLVERHGGFSSLSELALLYTIPGRRLRGRNHRPPSSQMMRHSVSDTGWTDRRASLTSTMLLRRLSALICSRVTGVGSFFTAATSMARHAESVESACASATTRTMPTTARSLPV